MPKIHTCPHPRCGKQFDRKYNLKCHRRIHSNEKPYHCSHLSCDRAFRWKSSLNHHLKSQNHLSPSARAARKSAISRTRTRTRSHSTKPIPPSRPTPAPPVPPAPPSTDLLLVCTLIPPLRFDVQLQPVDAISPLPDFLVPPPHAASDVAATFDLDVQQALFAPETRQVVPRRRLRPPATYHPPPPHASSPSRMCCDTVCSSSVSHHPHHEAEEEAEAEAEAEEEESDLACCRVTQLELQLHDTYGFEHLSTSPVSFCSSFTFTTADDASLTNEMDIMGEMDSVHMVSPKLEEGFIVHDDLVRTDEGRAVVEGEEERVSDERCIDVMMLEDAIGEVDGGEHGLSIYE